MTFGESQLDLVSWEDPSRSTAFMPKSFGLKRGPSLTFMDQGPTLMPKKVQKIPESPKSTSGTWSQSPSTPSIWSEAETTPKLWTQEEPQNMDFSSAFVKRSQLESPGSSTVKDSFSQDELEMDYFDERKRFGSEDFAEIPSTTSEFSPSMTENSRIDLGNLPMFDETDGYFEDIDGSDFGTNFVKKRPKKSYTYKGAFDQLVTFKPDRKSDKFGYAEIVHHEDGHHNDDHEEAYLGSASRGHDHHSSNSKGKTEISKSFCFSTFGQDD